MATTALAVTNKMGDQDQVEQQQGIEATHDNPQVETGEEAAAAVELTPDEQKDLLEVKRRFKEQYMPKRQLYVRRALRAFEVLKNNPYILYNESTADYDSLALIMQGAADKKNVDLYQYQDNIYQMLGLSFIAALSVDVSKTRYQPVDPKNEEDVTMAKKASLIHAFNERQNGSDGLQQLELLYLWCTGSYFCHVRHIIDRNRAGVKRNPIMGMQPTQVLPNRYICPECGSVAPEDQIASFGKLACPDCGAKLGDGDFYQAQSIPLPVKIGIEEVPNGMTAFNVYSGLNVSMPTQTRTSFTSR
jgi:rubredoxin